MDELDCVDLNGEVDMEKHGANEGDDEAEEQDQ
jgi:hypothetical protein